MADQRGLCAAGRDNSQNDECRPGRARGSAGSQTAGFAVDPLRPHPSPWGRGRGLSPVEELHLHQQYRHPTRLHARRCRGILQAHPPDRGANQRRESA